MLQQTHTVSNNGLQSFAEASPDYEFAPVGLGSMHEQAKKLAEYGRNGDIYVVHAAEGETVIPLEVLNANPKIKELLFGQMRGMGLDPQEFVVGSELNSINPDTGLPEFFFKSVFRGVKKAVKSVAKIAKKAAPIVIPLAAAYFGIPFLGEAFGAGTFGASFIGGGLGSLAGGASLKDSLKAGLMSGGLASLSAGVMSGLDQTTPGSSFMGGIKSSFTGQTPIYALDQAGNLVRQGTKYAASPFADVPGNFMQEIGLTSSAASDAAKASSAASDAQFGNIFGTGPNQNIMNTITGEGAPLGKTATDVYTAADPYTLKPGYDTLGRGESYTDIFGREAQGFIPAAIPPGPPTQLLPSGANKLKFSPNQTVTNLGQQNALDQAAAAAMAQKTAGTSVFDLSLNNPLLGGPDITTADILAQNKQLAFAPSSSVLSTLEKVNPSLLKRSVVPVAAAGLLADQMGAFEGEPVEEVNLANRTLLEGPTGVDLFNKNQSAYLLPDEALDSYRYDTGNPFVPTDYADGGYIEKPQNMNRGGTPQFPRREMLVQGPGTETSDDIPAMLSDGEFVMNAQAVRGADPSGNGNRQAGAKSLYDMMRNFEMRA